MKKMRKMKKKKREKKKEKRKSKSECAREKKNFKTVFPKTILECLQSKRVFQKQFLFFLNVKTKRQ